MSHLVPSGTRWFRSGGSRRSRPARAGSGGTRTSTAESASKIGSRTAFRLAWTTRSATVGIPSSRSFPLALGIVTCRTSTGPNSPDFSKSRIWPRNSSTPTQDSIMATVALSTPGVLAPLLVDTRSHACTRNAGSYTRLNRSPNRREEFSPAQRCNLICISVREISRVRTRPRHGAGIHWRIFGHCFPSLTDTLPPFPVCRAFPARSTTAAPSRPRLRQASRLSTARSPGRGTAAERTRAVPTFTCRAVDGLGTRLCPCGLAMTTPQTIRHGLPTRATKTQPGVPRPS